MMLTAKGMNGQVAFDGLTVTIHRKGLMARSSVGKGEKSIPVQHITGVQWKKAGPFVNGFIQFTVPGGNERRSAFGSQTKNAVKDENSVVFRQGRLAEFEALRDAVQAAIGRGPQASSAGGVADELTKLAQLRDTGVISAAEFEVQKSRLLG